MTNTKLMATPNAGSRTAHPDLVIISVISILWVCMVFIANPIGNFPLNDDWVYAQAVKSVLENGYYHFPSTSSANVGPQIYWGAFFCLPFGFSFTALRISSLVAGLGGVVALYFLIKRFNKSSIIATIGAMSLAVNPFYFSLANSFMTDVPFVSMQIISIFFMARGLQCRNHRDILLGVAFSLVAVLIRQIAVISLLGLAIAYPVRFGITARNIIKAALPAIVGVLIHIGYQYWLVSSGRIPVLSGHSNVNQLISFSGRGWYIRQVGLTTLIYLGMFLLPLITLAVHAAIRRYTSQPLVRGDYFIMIGVVLVTLVTWWKGLLPPLLPNIVHEWGIGPITLRDTYKFGLNVPIVPSSISTGWAIIGFLSIVSASCVIFCLVLISRNAVHNLRDPKQRAESWPTWLLLVPAAAYFGVLMLITGSLPMMDRYLLPFLPLLLVLFARGIPEDIARFRFNIGLSALLISTFGYFSVTATHDYLEWNRLRWVATTNLMSQGQIGPNQIDGGYEFNGLLAYDANYVYREDKSWWWVTDDTYMIASGPLPGYDEITRYNFERWFLGNTSSVVVLKKVIK